MAILPILLLLLLIFLLVFGKPLNEMLKKHFKISTSVKQIGIALWILLAVLIGFVYVDPLYTYLIFGIWFFAFVLGLTLIVGIIDLIIKTRYFKIPGMLVIFMLICYITVFLLKEG